MTHEIYMIMGSAEDPPLFLGLSDVCLRGLKCTKRVSLKKKQGVLSLKKRGGVGVQYKKKKGPGGSVKREFPRGGLPPPHIFNGIALTHYTAN